MTTPYPIKVYDTRPDGHNSFQVLPKLGEGDLAHLQDFYNFDIDYTYGYDRAQPGQLWWGLHGFELKAGPAILQPQVRDEAGNLLTNIPHPGILLFLSWPGADPFPVLIDPPYVNRGVGGWTESKGCVGWGFGGESHIGDDGGPYTVWASSDPETADYERRVGSEAVRRLGWWDDHIIPNPIFQVMRKGGTTPPPTGSEYLVDIASDGTITGHIAITPGPPPAGTHALGLSKGGVIVGHVLWVAGGTGT